MIKYYLIIKYLLRDFLKTIIFLDYLFENQKKNFNHDRKVQIKLTFYSKGKILLFLYRSHIKSYVLILNLFKND